MNESQDVVVFNSLIDPKYQVAVMYPEYEKYEEAKHLLSMEKESIAGLIVGKNLIIVDGKALEGLSEDQFIAVQAHEICHGVLEHSPGNSMDSEIEAEVSAIDLLTKLGKPKSAKILIDRIKEERGIVYKQEILCECLSKKSLDLYKKYLKTR